MSWAINEGTSNTSRKHNKKSRMPNVFLASTGQYTWGLTRVEDVEQELSVAESSSEEVVHENKPSLHSIRITLSNGEQSPHFQSSSSQNGPAYLDVRQDLSPYKIEIVTGPYTCEAVRISDR